MILVLGITHLMFNEEKQKKNFGNLPKQQTSYNNLETFMMKAI